MSGLRSAPCGAAYPPRVAEDAPGRRDSRLSRYFLLWLALAPFVGFALAGRLFMLGAEGESWELWKAASLGAVLMVPFAVGAYFGLRAVLKGYRGGWAGLVANFLLAALALGMPIMESLSG
jgi:hypothetical protein